MRGPPVSHDTACSNARRSDTRQPPTGDNRTTHDSPPAVHRATWDSASRHRTTCTTHGNTRTHETHESRNPTRARARHLNARPFGCATTCEMSDPHAGRRHEVSRGKGAAGAHSGIGGVAFTPALGHVPLPLRHLRGQSITCAAPRARRDWDMARRARHGSTRFGSARREAALRHGLRSLGARDNARRAARGHRECARACRKRARAERCFRRKGAARGWQPHLGQRRARS